MELINKIESLQNSNIKNLVDKRIQEFKNIKKYCPEELFKEMCFCILTANMILYNLTGFQYQFQ